MKNCSRYHGPVLQGDPVTDENESGAPPLTPSSMALAASSEAAGEKETFTQGKTDSSHETTDVEMKGILCYYSVDGLREGTCEIIMA